MNEDDADFSNCICAIKPNLPVFFSVNSICVCAEMSKMTTLHAVVCVLLQEVRRTNEDGREEEEEWRDTIRTVVLE